MKDHILMSAKRRKMFEKVLFYVICAVAILVVLACVIVYFFNIE